MRARAPLPRQPCHYEWLIVARWGETGEYLSLSWTDFVADGREAPIQLQPRRTVIGILAPTTRRPTPRWAAGIEFRLAATLPETVTVASRFIPAAGYIRLSDAGSPLRICTKGGSLLADLPLVWDLRARRAPWIGEFIDAAAC